MRHNRRAPAAARRLRALPRDGQLYRFTQRFVPERLTTALATRHKAIGAACHGKMLTSSPPPTSNESRIH
jgi:hypothetical protein